MAQDPYKYFRVEAKELLEQLSRSALDLEKSAESPELVPRLLRLAHTLKGAARVVKQSEIADETHAIEEALAPFRESAAQMPRERIDRVLKLLDSIRQRIEVVAAPAGAEPTPAGKPAAEEVLRTLRADVAEMDTLLDGIAEVHVHMGMLRKSLTAAERAGYLAELLLNQSASRYRGADTSADRPENGEDSRYGDNGDPTHSIVEELRSVVGGLERGVAESLERMDRELRQVRDLAEQLRLIPSGTLFTALERTARDAAKALGKQVAFEGYGGDVRLDAHVLDAAQAALHQCVRNAVAHGIEPAKERQAAGKPGAGRVRVEVARRGRRVFFSCHDDGFGVDLEAVRRAVERKGRLSSATQNLDAGELLRLLLRGGISTSGDVTEISGRGIGLDVVRETAERLGGEVSVRTDRGKGTTIELAVPLSLASVEALVVESAGRKVSVPLDAVRRTLRIAPSDIARGAMGESLLHEGATIPFAALHRLIDPNANTPRSARAESVVVVEGADGLAAMGVDRLTGTANIILRPLPNLVPPAPIVAGLSLDSEGNPQMVLDPDELIAAVRRIGLPPRESEKSCLPILIVDDSLTTRMLEQSILESAGFEVELAVSGEDGLAAARRKRYALFLVDVEMPGIDGFTFIERSRADPILRDIPAILVTSRASPEDRRRGEDVGARGYIVKGDFDQAEFLDRVRQLVS